MGRAIVVALLVAAGCGGEDGAGGGATCDRLAEAAGDLCPDLDVPHCVKTCESQNHPQGHLDGADACVYDVTTCDEALQCFTDDQICDT